MLSQILQFLIDTIASFLVFLLLARFHFQWLRVSFRNQIGEFVVALTDWLVLPARRVIPGLAGLDLATLLLAWLVQAATLGILFTLRGHDFSSTPGPAPSSLRIYGANIIPTALITSDIMTPR